MRDPYHLSRFVDAQDEAGVYERALAELRRARKASHWMWFVFPQIAGLGHSELSRRYAIGSLDEARAYLRHPVLGPRLRACASVVAQAPTDDAVAIFGPVDSHKLRSSMTLFAMADPGEPAFGAVLDRFFGGIPDPETRSRV